MLGREPEGLDPATLPSAADVVRGWAAQLDRGLRVELPDDVAGTADAARAALLLRTGSRRRPAPGEVAALEDWGFDAEAVAAWRRLHLGGRRQAARRPRRPGRWAPVAAWLGRRSPTRSWPEGPAGFLLDLRALLVRDAPDGEVHLMGELPPGWAGAGLGVRGAPTRRGLVSYAIRWHGDRPALLWEVDGPGAVLRAPGLDPAWVSDARRGEALLAPVPATR
ncbi:MAG: hypothetical protein M5U14_12075 [Acidimicrobiia bacterium]|nr:hypothetical protein [Acidimicrobiia bacterium]